MKDASNHKIKITDITSTIETSQALHSLNSITFNLDFFWFYALNQIFLVKCASIICSHWQYEVYKEVNSVPSAPADDIAAPVLLWFHCRMLSVQKM